MRRFLMALLTIGAFVAFTVTPSGAQEALSFEIDITEGSPADVVNGQVDVNDVSEHCNTDVDDLVDRFVPFGTALTGLFPSFENPQNSEDLTAFLYFVLALGISQDPNIAQDVLAQTFVMTFAEIATQEPVGEMGNFDPTTGQGSVTVPEVESGFWAVAVACVSPSADPATIQAAVRVNATLVAAELGLPSDPFPPDFDAIQFMLEDLLERFPDAQSALELVTLFLQELGPTILASVVEPDALGAQIFCVLDADGVCPDDAVPPDPPINGLAPPPPPTPTPRPAEPVAVRPAFTG